MKKAIQIYDTTLRDGSQSEDIAFTVEDKLRIAEKLDWLGVHYIEGGWPGANPKDTEFFVKAKTSLKLKKSKLVAFGSTKRAGVKVSDDVVMKGLIDSGAKAICIFGKSWDLHVQQSLNIPLDENLKIVEESIAYLKKNKREVLFDAEHFFDGYKANKNYAIKVLKAAKKGGVDTIVLCDTNGGCLPDEIEKIIKAVKKEIKIPLAIHCHNDSGVAVANSMIAVKNGAIQVQGTINGIGERCGNANLCTVMANLQLKQNYKTVSHLARLREVALFVDEMANRQSDRHQPYVGEAAFSHKGGVHVQAVLKNSLTYEHINPDKVGNRQRILISDLAGVAALVHQAKLFGIKLDKNDPRAKDCLNRIKELENAGYVFEGAEASLELLIRKFVGEVPSFFKLLSLDISDHITSDNGTYSAYSKAHAAIDVNGVAHSSDAMGVGPVHALDGALRQGLEKFYPALAQMKLLDYKVRVLSDAQGTASKVRVLLECGDDSKRWGTVGVSENIIQASFEALKDAIDFKLVVKN